ncbi:MAG: hypothetical protein QOH50_1185 [Kribbellaceae bacterium]|jgi:hypothetical protein|nr:hypothetical protein [Kribbellaceae bacterium]
MTERPAKAFSGNLHEPLVDDLLDETRGPEEDGPIAEKDGPIGRSKVDLLADEVADDVKPRD